MSLTYQKSQILQAKGAESFEEVLRQANAAAPGFQSKVERLATVRTRETRPLKQNVYGRPGLQIPQTPTNKFPQGKLFTPTGAKTAAFAFPTFTPRNPKMPAPPPALKPKPFEQDEAYILVLNKPRQEEQSKQMIPESQFQISLNSTKKAQFASYLYKNYVSDLVLGRNWVRVNKSAENAPLLSIMSYNILSPTHLQENLHLYSHTAEDHLAWRCRFDKITEEIIALRPDLICIQELDKSFADFMQPLSWCYRVIYKGRTGDKPDGCAILYNSQRVRFLAEYSIEYKSEDIASMDRDNIAAIGLFEFNGAQLLVANTHLLFNMRRGDVQAGQLYSLLQGLQLTKLRHPQAKVFVAGDFNLIPNSALYSFITTGNLNCRGLNQALLSNRQECIFKQASLPLQYRHITDVWRPHTQHSQEAEEWWNEIAQIKMELQDNVFKVKRQQTIKTVLTHFLSLGSAYGSPDTRDTGEPKITSFLRDFKGCVDYIFYEKNTVTLVEKLDLPNQELVCSFPGGPNQVFPSDHISLMAKFQVTSA